MVVDISYEYEQMIDVGKIIMECLDTSFLDDEVLEVIDRVKYFCSFLELNRTSCELNNLRKNIRSLKVNLLFNYKDFDFSGLYDIVDNIVYINYERLNFAIYHELFHMASRSSEEDNRTGFLKNITSDSIKYLGINEGYTDLLAERYFKEKGFYDIEKNISFLIEKIAGMKNMEMLYFRNNVDGLVSLLSNYSDEKDVLLFLDDFDYIHNHIDEEEKDLLNTKLFFVGEYLLKAFYLRQKNRLEDGLSYDMFIYEMAIYINLLSRYNIMNKITLKSVLFELIDDDVMNDCITLSKKM